MIRRLRNWLAFGRAYRRERLPISQFAENLRRFQVVHDLHELEVNEYFRFRLWRDELSSEQRNAFIGWRRHIRCLTALNPLPYRCLTEDKLVFSLLCDSLDLPVPKLLGVTGFQNVGGSVVTELPTLASVIASARSAGVTEVVIKPVDGTKGQRVTAFRIVDDRCVSVVADSPFGEVEFAQATAPYEYRGSSQRKFLIQERILPDEFTSSLGYRAPMSYRIITLSTREHGLQVIRRYLKIPGREVITDNLATGGYACPISSSGLILGGRRRDCFDVLHSTADVSSLRLSGWAPPRLEEVTALALKASSSFASVRCIAWDIAIGRQGLAIFEGNNPWNLDVQEVFDSGLWAGEFARESVAAENAAARPPWWI